MKRNTCHQNECRGCVFYVKRCLVGIRRPWNLSGCVNFLPYCLVCTYPEVFCSTCCNRAMRMEKPAGIEILGGASPPEDSSYQCVWNNNQHNQ